MNRYPIRFTPILKERVWGGNTLARRFGREAPTQTRIGESWDLVDRPSDSSKVHNGPLAGLTLRELCARFGNDLLGTNAPSTVAFPLIVKLLDPNDRLSVQVHPTAAYVERHPEAGATKNEVWYALDAVPGTQIIRGLKPGVTVDDLESALLAGAIEPLLKFIAVEPGGLYYVPSGLVHALLPGSLMVEIQQNCDTTFRLYDWGRLGLDGKPRALHVAEAIETIRTFFDDPSLSQYENLGAASLSGHLERIKGLTTPSFVVEEIAVPPGRSELLPDPGSFTILVAARGMIVASCVPGVPLVVELQAGDTALVPAGTEAVEIEAADGATLLTVSRRRSSVPRG